MKRFDIYIATVMLGVLFAGCSGEPIGESTGPTNTNPYGTGPFVFGTNTVTGFEAVLDANPFYTYSIYDGNVRIDTPANYYISADSYFVCRGSFDADSNRYPYMTVRVQPTNEAISATDYKLYYRGAFEQVVFLRSGPGVYKVKILIKDAVENVLYVAAYFYVTNVSPHNFLYLMPTGSVASLDADIRAKALEVAAPFGTDGEKARAIHDWIVKTLRYGGSSDAQDSDTVFETHEAVCQGYSCLAAAMFRSIGFPAKYVRGYVRGSTNEVWPDDITHAWNEVYYNGKWNIMDITWDDPIIVVDDGIPDHNDYPDGYNLRTNWFEPSLEFFYTRHTNWETVDYRDFETEYPLK